MFCGATGGKTIFSGTNLNDIITLGIYKVGSGSINKTLINSPFPDQNFGFNLICISAYSDLSNYGLQLAFSSWDLKVRYRQGVDLWTNWKTFTLTQ